MTGGINMTTENMAGEKQVHERPSLAELAKKVLLASIGAASIVQEEAEAFVHKLIEKGELAEKDGRVILKDLREKRKIKSEEELDKHITSIIKRLEIPTKSDIEVLSEKISEIAKKIEEL
jgi:polyhydroxyalkanoate synthesis regulator phasin